MRFVGDNRLAAGFRLRAEMRGAGRLAGLALFTLALALQVTLTWSGSGHIAATGGAACNLPGGGTHAAADHGTDSGNPAPQAPHDSRTCLQCQFFRNAAGVEPATVADTDASTKLSPEILPAPDFRAAESPRHTRPAPRAPPRLPLDTRTASA